MTKLSEEEINLAKSLKTFLGPDDWKELTKTTEYEFSLFKKVEFDVRKSYFVRGNRNLLGKFKSFFLTRCLKWHPMYTGCSLYEYAEGVSSPDKDEFGLTISKELLFLYMHEHMSTLGNSRIWLTETIINKVADRNRKGLVTVILSEIDVEEFERCGEMGVINLLEGNQVMKTSEALSDLKNNSGSSKSIYG